MGCRSICYACSKLKMKTDGVLLTVLLCCSCYLSAAVQPNCSIPSWIPPAPPKGLTLRQINGVIRHGDRTPWSGELCWPGDSSVWDCELSSAEIPMMSDSQYGSLLPRIHRKIYSFGDETLRGNCSVGQLTSLGYIQHQGNGKSLRQAYVTNTKFLSENLDSNELYIRADDVSRTLQSAEALLFGLYPPQSQVKETQVVDIHTMDATYEYMVANPKLCPMYGNYSTNFNKSQAWKDHHSQTVALIDSIRKATGYNITEDQLTHYADCLRTHLCHNLDMPKGFSEQLYSGVWEEVSWQYYNLYKYPSVQENAKTGIGFLLKEIWQNMNTTVMGKTKQKFLLYSGHDTTLMPLLVALQVDTGVWPLYASMLLFELYESQSLDQNAPKASKFSVRIIYNGKVLNLPFCTGGLCDYQTLSNYLATVTPPDDYSKLCGVSAKPKMNRWNF